MSHDEGASVSATYLPAYESCRIHNSNALVHYISRSRKLLG